MTRTLLAAAAALLFASTAHASTFKALYSFCQKANCADGALPSSPILVDSAGNLYGTTQDGGGTDVGVVYELTFDSAHQKWIEQVLSSFSDAGGHGYMPFGALAIDNAGNLYGTAAATAFNVNNGAGVVYELVKNQSWKQQVLYTFCAQASCADGDAPATGVTYVGQAAGVPYDGVSPLFGTTEAGGAHNSGVVFKLAPSKGKWTETVLHSFCSSANCSDGKSAGPLVADGSGNLWSPAQTDASGILFKMAPSNGNETLVWNFCSKKKCADGDLPGGVVLDAAGHVFGAAGLGGKKKHGLIYELAGKKFTVLHNFCPTKGCADGDNSTSLVMDGSGNLFGATLAGGLSNAGTLFEISANKTFTTIYNFCENACADGYYPNNYNPVLDGQGNLYGATTRGGSNDKGTVYQLAP